MRFGEERTIARYGMNTVQTFFELNGCVFQEVAQQNDFGKDGYVDLGENGLVSSLCAAVQIKAGRSYRTSAGDYFIPLHGHADVWRHSTVPVFGIVVDPDDDLIRWIDLTGYLRKHPEQASGNVRVEKGHVLSPESLHREFRSSLATYSFVGLGELTANLLSSGRRQIDAVYDSWALGRFDAAYMLLLRRLLCDLEPQAMCRGIALLSHLGQHPDIFWTKDNWISRQIKDAITQTFRWSPEELARMLRVVGVEDWGRGTLGQCVDVLLYEDPLVVPKLEITISLLLTTSETELAVRAVTLLLTHAPDQRRALADIRAKHPILDEEEWFASLVQSLQSNEFLSLYS